MIPRLVYRDIVVSLEMGYSLASGYRDTQRGYRDTTIGGLHLKLVKVGPVRYDAFDIKCARGLEVMVQTHIDNGSPFLELYVEFSGIDEGPQRLTYVSIQEARTKEQAESLMTQLYGGFTALLRSSHYDIPKSSIGRHLSVSALDVNHNRRSTEQIGFGGNTKY
ncbi:hypothetical protein J1N35_037402 [Gossypium stocksii]|uniref:Uncharacterized protein n=1 Tax=Gossypium stocksii TaxID=47602 RepID=A0A9D3UK29_9ROSI|nr:hypothetical protein J1N35_037402 [Gossypium stocksii]